MSINLWKLAGKPTGYSPLGSAVEKLTTRINTEYAVSFVAHSPSASKIRVSGNSNTYEDFTLTNTPKKYETFFTSKESNFYIFDLLSRGDIIVKDISVTEKPLGAATINGIDGFASGKWVLSGNYTVVDDETLIADARTGHTINYLIVDVVPWQTYTVKVENPTAGHIGVFDETAAVLIAAYTTAETLTFNSGNRTKVRIYLRNITNNFVLHTFKRPMLNLGSTPAPYSKKTGERMVKPEAWKNLIPKLATVPNKMLGSDSVIVGDHSFSISAAINTFISSYFSAAVEIGKTYTVSGKTSNSGMIRLHKGIGFSGALINGTKSNGVSTVTFTVDSSYNGFASIRLDNNGISGTHIISDIQIEEGTTATPYEPYAVQVNAKPRKAVTTAPKGLAFDGVADTLQMPVSAIDKIELDLMIPVGANTSGVIIDFRNAGAGSSFVRGTGGVIDNTITSKLDGVLHNGAYPLEKRMLASFERVNFSGVITVLASISKTSAIKATLYGVKCYLKGQLIAAYDFTQPGAVIGGKVLPNPVNLIPPFDDARWSLHPNFRVLGRDVGRLEATTSLLQVSRVLLPVKQNTRYRLSKSGLFGRLRVGVSDGTTYGALIGYLDNGSIEVVTGVGVTEVIVTVDNITSNVISDFIKPQLHELPATAGTLYGKPSPTVKPSKRIMYSKR